MAEPERLRRPATPKTRATLEQMVARYAGHYGIPQNRVRGWISFMVLGGALERLKDADGAPAFVVKGGVALELRLRLRGRATRDFDATFRLRFEEMLEALDGTLAEPYGGFQMARRGDVRDLGGRAKRVEVRVEYNGKSWATVQLEVSPAEGSDIEYEAIRATDLSEFGLDGPEFLHRPSARYQIAQKIHAVTTRRAAGARTMAPRSGRSVAAPRVRR